MGCPSLTNPSKQNIVEQLSYYIISAAILILRCCVRLRTRGWRRFQVDDYITMWVLFCVGCAGFFTNASLWLGGTWLFLGAPEEVDTLRKCQVESARMGSIYNVLNWYMYTGLIWGLKAMMLVFLNRLYCGLARYMIRWVAIACGLSFLVCYIVVTFSCHPIQKNWQVKPLPEPRCMRRVINIYTVSGLNAATDFCILLIPLRLLRTVQVSVWKKILLGLLLCSGILIMTTALLRVGFLHTSRQVGQISNWGSREVLVATVVVNMPIIAPIMKKSFWRREYRSQTPHRSASMNIRRSDAIGGIRDGSLGGPPHSGEDDLSTPYTPDSEYNGNTDHMNTMSMRNDSAAATILKTEFRERVTAPKDNEEHVSEDAPLRPRCSSDRDIGCSNADGRLVTSFNRMADTDLPSSPEPAHFGAQWSERRPDIRRQNGWMSNATPRGFELNRLE